MPERYSRFTTKHRNITGTGEFAWGGESGWSSEVESSENIRITSDGVQPATAPPPNGLVHRYDATNLSVTDGETVSSWPDQEGSADLSGGIAPTYQSSTINVNAIVRYDGVDDYLEVEYATISEPYQIYVVGQMQTLTGSSPVIIVDGWSNAAHQIGQDIQNSTDKWYGYQGTPVRAGNADTNPHVFEGIFRAGPNNDEILTEGTQELAGDTGTAASDGLTVGTRGDTSGNYANVDVGEILIYDTELSSSQAIDVRQYLSDKWGIAL